MGRTIRNASKSNRKTPSTTRATRQDAGAFEALEDRRLFATLTIAGTLFNDYIRLHQTGQVINVMMNNTVKSYAAARFTDVVVNCLDGNDRVVTTSLFNKPLTLNGGAGNDNLQGGRRTDVLNGGDGDDLFNGAGSADVFNGGAGTDCADYANTAISVNVSLDDVANDGRPGEGDNVRSDVENIVGSYGNDTLTGSAAANYIQGAGGTDTIYGLGGPDTLDGGIGGSGPASRNNGNDVIWGGDGNDTLHASDYGNNTLYGDGGKDVLWGYNGTDKLYGASGDDWLFGGNNADELFGGTGDDYVDGQAGNDKAYGNSGPLLFVRPLPILDTIPSIVDGTSNTIMFGEAGATISPVLPVRDIDITIDPVLPPIDLTPRVPSRDDLQLDVSDVWLPPIQVVETDNDIIWGGTGNDRLRGDGGNDQVNGDAGNDVCYGDTGNDVVHGNEGKDRLFGGSGDDDLFGDEGDDILVSIGGGQSDENTGGAGFDSIWCDAESSELDHNDFWDALFEGAAGSHHRVAGFQTLRTTTPGGATIATQTPSRELNGQNLLDPIGSGTYQDFSDRPLFAPGGASPDDIDQGGIGDCYFLAGLSSTARVADNRIHQAIVDLGDGTYAMRFYKDGAETYYRVDGQLLVNGAGNPTYAGLGTADSMWVPIMEKVFTFARSNLGTFQSIHGGGGAEPFNALNMSSYTVAKGSGGTSSQNATETLQNIKAELDNDRAVVVVTPNSPPPAGTPAVPWHLYSVVSVNLGTNQITLRNPWASDGGGNNDGSNDGYVTFTASQFHNYFTGIRAGVN